MIEEKEWESVASQIKSEEDQNYYNEWVKIANQVTLMSDDLDFRSNEFERRRKFYLLCYCAIASCVGTLAGATVFALMGVID